MKIVSQLCRLLLLGTATLACVFPFTWLAINAFRSRTDITASPPRLTGAWTTGNFMWVYNGQSLIELVLGSVVISIGTVVLSVLIGLPAAYFFSRVRSRLSRKLFVMVLATRMAPPVALSLPLFVLFTAVGLRGTYWAPMLAHTVFSMAFVVWFLEGFISGIPTEVEMAAQLDGRSRVGALASVVVPALKIPLIATAVFVALFSWNEYMMSSLLTSSTTRPLTPALPGFIAQATSQWGPFCAVALVSALPSIAVAIGGQRFLARVFSTGLVREGEG